MKMKTLVLVMLLIVIAAAFTRLTFFNAVESPFLRTDPIVLDEGAAGTTRAGVKCNNGGEFDKIMLPDGTCNEPSTMSAAVHVEKTFVCPETYVNGTETWNRVECQMILISYRETSSGTGYTKEFVAATLGYTNPFDEPVNGKTYPTECSGTYNPKNIQAPTIWCGKQGPSSYRDYPWTYKFVISRLDKVDPISGIALTKVDAISQAKIPDGLKISVLESNETEDIHAIRAQLKDSLGENSLLKNVDFEAKVLKDGQTATMGQDYVFLTGNANVPCITDLSGSCDSVVQLLKDGEYTITFLEGDVESSPLVLTRGSSGQLLDSFKNPFASTDDNESPWKAIVVIVSLIALAAGSWFLTRS